MITLIIILIFVAVYFFTQIMNKVLSYNIRHFLYAFIIFYIAFMVKLNSLECTDIKSYQNLQWAVWGFYAFGMWELAKSFFFIEDCELEGNENEIVEE